MYYIIWLPTLLSTNVQCLFPSGTSNSSVCKVIYYQKIQRKSLTIAWIHEKWHCHTRSTEWELKQVVYSGQQQICYCHLWRKEEEEEEKKWYLYKTKTVVGWCWWVAALCTCIASFDCVCAFSHVIFIKKKPPHEGYYCERERETKT